MEGFFYGLEKQEGQPWPWRVARFKTIEALTAWLAHPVQRYDSETGRLETMDGYKRFMDEGCIVIEDAVRHVQVRRHSEWCPSRSLGDQDGMFLWLPVQ